jgi:hypothetical protein
VSSSSQKPITLGVTTDLIRGDVFFWGEIMAGALIAAIPVAIAYNLFLDRFIAGITGGAVNRIGGLGAVARFGRRLRCPDGGQAGAMGRQDGAWSGYFGGRRRLRERQNQGGDRRRTRCDES